LIACGYMEKEGVCYIGQEIFSPPTEGHHIASRQIINAAIQAGVKAHIISIEKKNGNGRSQNKANWTIVYLRTSPIVTTGLSSSISTGIREIIASLVVTSKAKSSKCNLIHILNITKESYILSHRLLRVDKPVVLHFYHSPYVLNDDVFFARNIALKIGLYRCIPNCYMLTSNRSFRNFLIEKCRIPYNLVQCIPYPIDTDKFKPLNFKKELRQKYSLPADRVLLVYVGSLHPARGLFTLINSLAEIKRTFPKVLLLISHLQPRSPAEEACRKTALKMIKDLGLNENLLFTGPSSNVEELYNLADVVVLPFERPYWLEPPLVLLEAMSCGVPVVSTNVGAINELIKNGENGLLTSPNDPTDLAESISKLIGNSDFSKKVAKNARGTIVQSYSYEVIGKKLSDFYFNIVK